MLFVLLITLSFALDCNETGHCQIEENNSLNEQQMYWKDIIELMKGVLGQMWKHVKTEGVPIESTWEEVNKFLTKDWVGKTMKGMLEMSGEMQEIINLLNEAVVKQKKEEISSLIELLKEIKTKLIHWKETIGDNGVAKDVLDSKEKTTKFISDGINKLIPSQNSKDLLVNLGQKWLQWALKKSLSKKKQDKN